MTIEKNDDYIKRSWALQESEHDLRCHDISRSTEKSLFVNLGDVVRMLLAAPKENVVPVVRCGECKHWHRETGYCELHSYFHDSEGLCCSPSESPKSSSRPSTVSCMNRLSTCWSKSLQT